MRRLFWIQLLFGICVIGWGMVVIPAMPHVMLDVVLTPVELQDEQKRDATLQLLQKANFASVPIAVTGLFLVITSAFGLWLSTVKSSDGM